jgi:hypothetical protein
LPKIFATTLTAYEQDPTFQGDVFDELSHLFVRIDFELLALIFV